MFHNFFLLKNVFFKVAKTMSHLVGICPISKHVWSSSNFQDIFLIIKIKMIHDVKDDSSFKSTLNFQDIFLIIYWHDLWCQRWPHPPSLKSGTLSVLHVPNKASLLNHEWSSSNFQDILLIIYQHDLRCQRWHHPSSSQSGTINIFQAPM